MKAASLFITFLLLPAALYPGPGTGTLKITITNIKEVKGTLFVALPDGVNQFSGKWKPGTRARKVQVTGQTMTISFTGLPLHASYAVKVFHDTNSNGKLDTKIFGIPKEPYGFSNNPVTRFGPPSWKKASFNFTRDGQVVNIKLK